MVEPAVTVMGLALMVFVDRSKGMVEPVWLFSELFKPPVWARPMFVDLVNPVHPAGREPRVIVKLPVPIVALTRVPEPLTGTVMDGVVTGAEKLTPEALVIAAPEREGVIVTVSCLVGVPPEVVAVKLTLKGLGRVTLPRGMVAVPPATKSTRDVVLARMAPAPSVKEILEAFRVKVADWPVMGAKRSWRDPEAKVAELKSFMEIVMGGRVAEADGRPVSTTVVLCAPRCPFTVDSKVALRSKLAF